MDKWRADPGFLAWELITLPFIEEHNSSRGDFFDRSGMMQAQSDIAG